MGGGVLGCCLGCGWVFGGRAVWGALRVTVQAHICEIDGRVQGACSLGCCCRCCFGMLFGGASDGAGARLTTGCCLGRSSGGAVGGAGAQSLLSGVYAGVFSFSVWVLFIFCRDGNKSREDFLLPYQVWEIDVFPQIAESYRGSNF